MGWQIYALTHSALDLGLAGLVQLAPSALLMLNASNQLGAFESGATAAILGTVPAVVLGGIGTIAVALLWMKLLPTLRRVERLDGAIAQ